MDFETKINEGIKEAMKAQDKARLRALRGIKSAILLAKTDGSGLEVDEARGMAILQKLLKQRKDSYDIFMQQNRTDLATIEMEEIEVIQLYLPKAMSLEEVEQKLKEIILESGTTSIKDMGKVMGLATKEMAGKADGKVISELVKKLLA